MDTNNKLTMHVSLGVSDIAACKTFYQTLFRTEPVREERDYLKFSLKELNLDISFTKSSTATKETAGHFGIKLSDGKLLELERQRLKAYTALDEGEVECCYSVQNKFWVVSPSGHKWEIYTKGEDVHVEDASLAATSEEVCCGEDCCV